MWAVAVLGIVTYLRLIRFHPATGILSLSACIKYQYVVMKQFGQIGIPCFGINTGHKEHQMMQQEQRQHKASTLAGVSLRKTLIEFSEHAGLPPKLSVADDVNDFLRTGDSHVQQVWTSAGPATSASLCRIRGAQDENHRLSF